MTGENWPTATRSQQSAINSSALDSRSRFLLGFLRFFVLALLSFSHDRSPCVGEAT